MIVVASLQRSSKRRVSRDGRLKFGLARGTNVLTEAFRLVHDQYVARGYMSPDPSGLRLSLHHVLPSTKVFVARARGRVVGTLTLIKDSPLRLPMDELYGDDLARFRSEGRCLAEVSALAVDDGYRSCGGMIVVKLVRLLVAYAMEVGQNDDICIMVNPRHLGFYRRLFPDAHQIGEVKAYQKVNGAPAVALRLDLHVLRTLIPALQASCPGLGTRYEFLFHVEELPKIVARLRRESRRSGLTSRQFVRLFAAHPAVTQGVAEGRAVIESLYSNAGLETRSEPLPTTTMARLHRHALAAALGSA